MEVKTLKYYMPVKVYDETNCVRNHASELAALGRKALIITGRHSAKACGALDDVIAALTTHGCTFCHFSEVEENPSVETVVLAAEYGLEEGADFVIGIGGGSPMDAAKAAAFLMDRDRPEAGYLYNKDIETTALPVAAVPTTCGTGSEVTAVSVLTMHNKRTKSSIPHKIFPELALIDGKYLTGAPFSVIVSTSADALAHLIESYLSSKADDYSRYTALSGLQIWSTVRGILVGERPASGEDMAALMRASTYGGMAIAQTGTSLPHALSYIVTYDTKLSHGFAVGIFLTGFLSEASEEDREKILTAAGFADLGEFSAFMKEILPNPVVPEETMQRTFEAVAAAPAKMESCCFKADEEMLHRIIASAG